MNSQLRSLRTGLSRVLLGVGLVALPFPSLASAPMTIDPDKVMSGEAYILLQRTGVVLHGEVQPQGTDVLIVDGSAKMSIKASEIRHMAREKIELYHFQIRNTVRMGDGEHLHMAFWCLENGLLDLAGVHYQALRERIPNEPKFKQLEVQLRQKLLEDPESRRAFGMGPKISKSPSESIGPVRTASATEPEHPISAPIAVEYRESILPLLRTRCGQSGCHGLQGPTPLLFPQSNAMAFATLQKSLHSAIGYVRKSDPLESPLLKMATQVHSTQSKPSFDVGNPGDAEHLARIERWIRLVVSQEGVQPASSSAPQSRVGAGAPPSAFGNMKPNSMAPYDPRYYESRQGNSTRELEQPAVVTLIPGGGDLSASGEKIEPKELRRLDEAIRKLEQAEKERTQRDPFDPEPFNRQIPKPATTGTGPVNPR